MSTDVVYSACYRFPGSTDDEFREVLEMVELWLAHLRGPGKFNGRVLLLTNQPVLPFRDVELVKMDDRAESRTGLFRQRPLAYDRLPVQPGERWMQMDADSLAVRPIEPLFVRRGDDRMVASPSGLTALANASPVLSRPRQIWYSRVRGWRGRMGVSACLTSCNAEHWQKLMRPWADAIREYNAIAAERSQPSGDQGFLNLMYISGKADITPLPPGLVFHVGKPEQLDEEAAQEAHWLHFPNPWKLELMKRRSVV